MPNRSRKSPTPPARPVPKRAAAGSKRPGAPCAACVRRLRHLEAEREEDRARHARQVAAVRRAADRRLAAMMQEIALLRHHQARVTALERLLAERTRPERIEGQSL